ncbi:hypothetical protein [Burkholderia gladioli]|uniref:hypothetical protein n=1 Tax=Burkholderia gladioli TaxID=28095 RepID=UPI000AC82E34|nr:hypothetical protein [Burkholderia gladioli]
MKFTYSESAQQRVALQGVTSINTFVGEVASATRQKIFGALPVIPGFRKGPALLKKQRERLIHTLGHVHEGSSRATRNYWSAFGAIWASWGNERFPQGFPEGPFDFADASEDDAIEFVRKLVDNEPSGCAREDVERLVLFSGLPTSDALSVFISRLPLKETIKRDRALARLPDDVEEIRSRLADVGQSVATLGSEIRANRADSVSTVRLAQRAFDSSEEAQHKLVEVEKRAASFQKEISTLSEKITAQSQQIDTTLKVRFDSWSTSESDLRTGYQSLRRSVSELADELAAVKESVARASEEHEAVVGSLRSKIDSVAKLPVESRPFSLTGNGHAFPRLVRWLGTRSDVEPTRVEEIDAFFELAIENLTASGVRQTDADGAARAIVGATLAGQLLQCSGSLADVLGTAVAVSVGGDKTLSWDVPLGLCNGCDIDSVLQMATEGAAQAIVLKGVNRSAFEIYGTAIRDVIVRRQLAPITQGANLVATWAEGPATLPGGCALIELGPLVDTDNLAWGSVASQSRLKPGQLMLGERDTKEVRATFGDELAEIHHLVDSLGLPSNRLWRMAFSRFCGFLFTLPDATFDNSVSVALNTWAIPWAKAKGAGRDKLEEAIKSYAPEQLKVPSVRNALSELTSEVLA